MVVYPHTHVRHVNWQAVFVAIGVIVLMYLQWRYREMVTVPLWLG